jgi:hypothetical protein
MNLSDHKQYLIHHSSQARYSGSGRELSVISILDRGYMAPTKETLRQPSNLTVLISLDDSTSLTWHRRSANNSHLQCEFPTCGSD